MNLRSANIAIRQRGVLEVFDLAYVMIRTLGRRLYTRLALLTLLPSWGLCVLARWGLDLGWVWVWLAALVICSVSQGPFTIAAGQLMFQRKIATREIVQTFASRWLSLLGALLLSRLLLALGAVTVLLLPSLWSRVLFVHEISLLEAASGRECLRRAASFVRYHGGSTFATLALHAIMTALCVLWAEMLGWGIVTWLLQFGEPFGSLWTDGGSPYALAGLFLSAPLIATARYLAYVDGRTRRDAWDVQVRFQAIAMEAKGVTP